MRTKPINWNNNGTEVQAEPEKVNQQSFENSIVRDLSEEIARPVKEVVKPVIQESPAEPAESSSTTSSVEPEAEATGTDTQPDMDKAVVKLKEKIGQALNETIADPKRASKTALRFINTIRFFVYPVIYKKIIFDGPEANDLDKVLRVVAEFKQKPENQGKEVLNHLNDYQRSIYKKYLDYDRHKKAVLWTPDELEQINEVAYLKLAEVKMLRWLMENEWMLVLLIIEGKRLMPVAATRFGITDLDLSLL